MCSAMNASRRCLKSAQRSLGWKSIVLLPLVMPAPAGLPAGVYRLPSAGGRCPRAREGRLRRSSARTYAAGMSGGRTSYRAAGVDYEALDAAKRLAMAEALGTSALLRDRGGHARDDSRGEPAFVFE